MSGSHIHAVPAAQRFDGIIGVVGALGVGRVLGKQRVVLQHPYECCSPGARNVIRGEVRFSIDFRDSEGLDAKWIWVAPKIRTMASARQLAMVLPMMSASEPVALSPTIQDMLEQVCHRRGLSCRRMPIGAVHDAQVMAQPVDTGMIFIPSRGGRSHCPEEYSEPVQVEQSINVLLKAVLALAG